MPYSKIEDIDVKCNCGDEDCYRYLYIDWENEAISIFDDEPSGSFDVCAAIGGTAYLNESTVTVYEGASMATVCVSEELAAFLRNELGLQELPDGAQDEDDGDNEDPDSWYGDGGINMDVLMDDLGYTR